MAVRHEPSSAAVVRTALAKDLAAHNIAAADVNDVILVASELIGNAILHARAVPHDADDDIDVTWDVRGNTVTVRVRDGSSELPKPRVAQAQATNGRGLTIVAALADEWGVRRLRRGKQVWARVPVSRTA